MFLHYFQELWVLIITNLLKWIDDNVPSRGLHLVDDWAWSFGKWPQFFLQINCPVIFGIGKSFQLEILLEKAHTLNNFAEISTFDIVRKSWRSKRLHGPDELGVMIHIFKPIQLILDLRETSEYLSIITHERCPLDRMRNIFKLVLFIILCSFFVGWHLED